MNKDDGSDAVERVLSWGPGKSLGPLWAELHRRMGASDRPVRTVTVEFERDGERVFAGLFKRDRLGDRGPVRVDVGKLRAALGINSEELRRVVEGLVGPIVNRARERETATRSRLEMWAAAEDRVGHRIPKTLERIKAAGVPRGELGSHAAHLAGLCGAVERLPLSDPLPLPVLAWQVCGDPHGLDTQTIAGRWLAIALLELAGDDPRAGETLLVRAAASANGVVQDRLSTPTLTLGLRAEVQTPAGQLLDAAAKHLAPVHLSGGLLDMGEITFTQKRWLCVENPSVVESAALAGLDVPMVCTSGWPSTEVQRLLTLAREQGIELCYAGDYDSPGLAMARYMMERYEARILMTAELYGAAELAKGQEWEGAVGETPWDPGLRRAIEREGKIVFQEDTRIIGGVLAEF